MKQPQPPYIPVMALKSRYQNVPLKSPHLVEHTNLTHRTLFHPTAQSTAQSNMAQQMDYRLTLSEHQAVDVQNVLVRATGKC